MTGFPYPLRWAGLGGFRLLVTLSQSYIFFVYLIVLRLFYLEDEFVEQKERKDSSLDKHPIHLQGPSPNGHILQQFIMSTQAKAAKDALDKAVLDFAQHTHHSV